MSSTATQSTGQFTATEHASPSTTGRPHVVDLDGTRPGTREVLGGKAYSVNRMREIGLPVPPAFALPTYECADFHERGGALDDAVWEAVVSAVRRLESETGRTFGQGPSPLLVSVRSGAAQSMPGMMDTVLNLGLTPDLARELATESGDAEWAEDTWQRFVRAYADIVAGSEDALPPTDPWQQLRAAIGAVFGSWTNDRVRAYRERHALGAGGGTAVTVQAMVFGNRDAGSGTGVMFSRDPSTGEPVLYGEWLARAQGEDVVSGEATPQRLAEVAVDDPALHAELTRVAQTLEREHGDLVDIEFTVESGRLFMLQCRSGKRSPQAALRIAADLVAEGAITPAEALSRVTAEHVESLAGRRAAGDAEVLATGLGASPGVATGHVARTHDEVSAHVEAGRDVVLVRTFTAPDDVPAMFESVAVVTEVGGATSHAALVCREIALPCVVGIGAGKAAALEGQVITVDGATGRVLLGAAGEQLAAATPDEPWVLALADLARSEGVTDHPVLGLPGATRD